MVIIQHIFSFVKLFVLCFKIYFLRAAINRTKNGGGWLFAKNVQLQKELFVFLVDFGVKTLDESACMVYF